MPRGRLEGIVHRLVANLKKKGLFLFGGRTHFFEPTEGLIGQKVCVVSFECLAFAIDIEGRIKVSALTRKADPVIETLARRIVLMAHVPLADIASQVSRIL